MNKVLIRYSRDDNRSPKNTLATVRDGDKLYFGIARCNSNEMFRKRIGREVATTRALRASKKSLFMVEGSNLMLDETGLRGVVNQEHSKELIGYFNEIDHIILVQE